MVDPVTLAFIEIKCGDMFVVDISQDSTISQLKSEISRLRDLPLEHMRIIFTREQTSFCPDSATIESLGITSSDILKLYAKGIHRDTGNLPPPARSFSLAPVQPKMEYRCSKAARSALNQCEKNRGRVWHPGVYREMMAYSRSPLTMEEAMMVFVLAVGRTEFYSLVLRTDTPFRRYFGIWDLISEFALLRDHFALLSGLIVTNYYDLFMDSLERDEKMGGCGHRSASS
jgi:hypothetical protein